MPKGKLENIPLGSGKLYAYLFEGTIPSDATIETTANQLGLISGGASVSYKPSYATFKDDLGLVEKTVVTDEEAILKTGIMTWTGDTLKKMSSTARVTEAAGKRTVKIGGIGNQDGLKYIIRFVHEDPADGDTRITIVGKNQAGFELAYIKDKNTVIDAEIKAAPHDSEGTLIVFEESINYLAPLEVTSIEGSTIGKTAIAVLPDLLTGNSYVYKTGSGAGALPAFDAECVSGYTAWTYTTEITATTGNYILIVEINSSNKAVKAGIATVVSKS